MIRNYLPKNLGWKITLLNNAQATTPAPSGLTAREVSIMLYNTRTLENKMIRNCLPEYLALEWRITLLNDPQATATMLNDLREGIVSILLLGVEPIGNTTVIDTEASLLDWFRYVTEQLTGVEYEIAERNSVLAELE